MCHIILHPPADADRSKLLTRKCFQSSFLLSSKEGFRWFLSSPTQSVADVHWEAFMLDSPLILTSLLLLPKQIWMCKFKPPLEHKSFLHLSSWYFQKSLHGVSHPIPNFCAHKEAPRCYPDFVFLVGSYALCVSVQVDGPPGKASKVCL